MTLCWSRACWASWAVLGPAGLRWRVLGGAGWLGWCTVLGSGVKEAKVGMFVSQGSVGGCVKVSCA